MVDKQFRIWILNKTCIDPSNLVYVKWKPLHNITNQFIAFEIWFLKVLFPFLCRTLCLHAACTKLMR